MRRVTVPIDELPPVSDAGFSPRLEIESSMTVNVVVALECA
jgi:hypothetical protein